VEKDELHCGYSGQKLIKITEVCDSRTSLYSCYRKCSECDCM